MDAAARAARRRQRPRPSRVLLGETARRAALRACAMFAARLPLASNPKDLNRDVVTGASGREGAPLSLMAFVRQVDGPAHHRQDKLNVRIAGSHGRELGQLGPENFDLAAQMAATEQSEAILPNGVGQEFGPRRSTCRRARNRARRNVLAWCRCPGRRAGLLAESGKRVQACPPGKTGA